MNAKTHRAALFLLNVPENSTVNGEHCPACGKAKLSVTNNDGAGLLYNCFSASCGFKGYLPINSSGLFATDRSAASQRGPQPYTGRLVSLCDAERDFLRQKVGFQNWHFGQSGVMLGENGRFAFPLFDERETIKGWVLRTYENGVLPKALTYLNHPANTKSSWYRAHPKSDFGCNEDTVFLVEDIPSAVRLSKFVHAIALTGTTIDKVDIPLMAFKYDNVVIAMDADAYQAGLRMSSILAGWFSDVAVWRPGKDFKDMTDSEIYDTLYPPSERMTGDEFVEFFGEEDV